ncbi:MAG: ABC transporter permease [Nitrospirae bacterium]|nr:MAG: ABC transporter permease [Nitrospirota bacterium]
MWVRIQALMIKEFLALLKDKKTRTVILIPPMVQLLVFGYAATFDLNHIPFALYNEDAGPWGRHMAEAIQGSPHFDLVARISHEADMAPLIDLRKALVIVRIGQHFSRRIAHGEPADMQVLVDGRNSNTALLALNYLRTIVQQFIAQIDEPGQSVALPVKLEVRAWFNPNLESRWFFIPGIVGSLTMIVALLVTALSVAREREQGTFDQLLVTPLRPTEILIGKTVPGFLIGLLEATVIIALARWWFEIPLVGNLVSLYCGLAVFLLSGLGVGLMISSLAVTQQQGLLGVFVFMVPAILLSGFATPIANMPSPVQYLTFLNPMRYFMIVVRGIFLEDMPVDMLLWQLWPMAVIGLIALSFAGWLFRHRLY